MTKAMTYVTRNATKYLGSDLPPILLGYGSRWLGFLVLVLAEKSMLDLRYGFLRHGTGEPEI